MMAANDTEIPEIAGLDLNAVNFDTSEFWKCRDEKQQNSLNEKLLEISRNGPSEAFTSILQKEQQSPSSPNYIDLDIVDKSGWSPLIHASFNGHLEIVKEILCHQENKYKQDFKEETSTDDDHGDDDKPKELKYKYHFKQFLRRKVKWNGSTALHLSCARGHEAIVKLLINKMVNDYKISLEDSINAIDDDLATPLHCAVLGKHSKICEILLMNGSIINKCDIRGKTPMDWAHERGLNDYVVLLRKYQPQTQSLQALEINLDSINDDISSKVVESIWEEQERKSMEPCNEANNSWTSSLLPSSSPTPETASCEPIPSQMEIQYQGNQNVTILQNNHYSLDQNENNAQFNFECNSVDYSQSQSPSIQYPHSQATPNNTPHANTPHTNTPHANENTNMSNNQWYPPQHAMNNPQQNRGPNHLQNNHYSQHHLAPPHPNNNHQQQYSHFHGNYQQTQQYQNQQHYNPHSHRMRAPRHIRYQQQRFGYQQHQHHNNMNPMYPPQNGPYPLHRHQSLSPRLSSNNLPNNMPPLTISKSWDPQYHPPHAQTVSTSDVVKVPSKVDSTKKLQITAPSKPDVISNDDGKLEESADNNNNNGSTKIRDKIMAAKQEQAKEKKPEVAVDDELKESDDPNWDVMKFQNKYLEARCESLEKEKKELMAQYKKKLHEESQKNQTRERLLMDQLDGKKRQIRDLRHTMRQMRQFLDSLPVRMRKKFYRDHGNFSRKLYDQKQQNEVKIEQNKDEVEEDENVCCDELQGNCLSDERQQQQQDKNKVQCTTNGWKTVTTEHLRESPDSSGSSNDSPKEKVKKMKEEKKEKKDEVQVNGNGMNHGNHGGYKQRNWNKNNNKNARSKRYYNHNQRKYGNNQLSRGNKMDNDTSWRRKR